MSLGVVLAVGFRRPRLPAGGGPPPVDPDFLLDNLGSGGAPGEILLDNLGSGGAPGEQLVNT